MVFCKVEQKQNETRDKDLKKLSDNNMTLNAKKCDFNKAALEFFGFIKSNGGMKPDRMKPDLLKVEGIQNLVPPTNDKELRNVLSMIG